MNLVHDQIISRQFFNFKLLESVIDFFLDLERIHNLIESHRTGGLADCESNLEGHGFDYSNFFLENLHFNK